MVAALEGSKRDTNHCAREWVDSGRGTVQYREPVAGEFEGTPFVRRVSHMSNILCITSPAGLQCNVHGEVNLFHYLVILNAPSFLALCSLGSRRHASLSDVYSLSTA
jgi:hypothetical protein